MARKDGEFKWKTHINLGNVLLVKKKKKKKNLSNSTHGWLRKMWSKLISYAKVLSRGKKKKSVRFYNQGPITM